VTKVAEGCFLKFRLYDAIAPEVEFCRINAVPLPAGKLRADG